MDKGAGDYDTQKLSSTSEFIVNRDGQGRF